MNITRKNTPNQYALGGDIKAIILHTTLGAYSGAVNWLMKSPAQRLKETGRKSYSSAHYVIGRNGEITQLAPLNRGTWHAGAIKNPTKRAKDALPKYVWGKLKNPNLSTIGIEFASGYDIDRDGVLESWERLYTAAQIKACVWLILNELEPQLKKQFGSGNIITHKDVTSYKPDLEKQRAMVVAELQKQRAAEVVPQPPKPPVEVAQPVARATTEIVIENGGRLQVQRQGGSDKIFIRKS